MSVPTAPHTDLSTNANAGLDARLVNSSADVSWPSNRVSLTALLDLGLSVEQIARYFSVDAAEVVGLLNPPITTAARLWFDDGGSVDTVNLMGAAN